MSTHIRLVVCDLHEMCRRALRLLLDEEPDFLVVGEACPADVAEVTRQLHPDIVVVEADPCCADGADVAARVRQACPAARAVVVTACEDDEVMAAALRAGAGGFLLKGDPVKVICDALRQVGADAAVLSPRMTKKMLDRASPLTQLAAPPRGLDLLTGRELETLLSLARGLSNREIAAETGIAVATVKAHVSRLLTKLGLRDRAGAVVYAYESGLVRPGGAGTHALR
jgi:DNA-binding NarL/FixJ family response regulator